MLIGATDEPTDSPDYINEAKLDGIRCVAYLETGKTTLRNKRNLDLLPRFPELEAIHLQVDRPCILDGELSIVSGGRPVFAEVRRRATMSHPFRIRLAADTLPASFSAFDILCHGDEDLMAHPLLERKELLTSGIVDQTPVFAVVPYIRGGGIALYKAAESMNLEGTVAKQVDSRYRQGAETKDWIRSKILEDDDFFVAGFFPKHNRQQLILAQMELDRPVYRMHLPISMRSPDFRAITASPRANKSLYPQFPDFRDATWIRPHFVVIASYMSRSRTGYREPRIKGFRDDKAPDACVRRE